MEQSDGQQRDISPVSEPAPNKVHHLDQILSNQVVNQQPQSDHQLPSDPTAVSRKTDQSLEQGSMFSDQSYTIVNQHIPVFDSADKNQLNEYRAMKLKKEWLENQLTDLKEKIDLSASTSNQFNFTGRVEKE